MNIILKEIKEKLEEALEIGNWDIIIELIGDIEFEENLRKSDRL